MQIALSIYFPTTQSRALNCLSVDQSALTICQLTQFWSGRWYKTENIQSLKLFRTENVHSLLSYKSSCLKETWNALFVPAATPGFIALLFAKAVVATTVSANVKLSTANQDQTSANETLKPGRPIPSVTTKNYRSGMTAYWKTTKDLHKPSEIRKRKHNFLDNSWRRRRKSTKKLRMMPKSWPTWFEQSVKP